MNKKFELTNESTYYCGVKVYRIKALKDFGNVKAGDLGGFVEREANLSHEGDCWVYDNAIVCNAARVYGNAIIRDYAKIYDYAKVFDNARVYGNAKIFDYAKIYDNAEISNTAQIFDNAIVYNMARIYERARVFEKAGVGGNASVFGKAVVCDDVKIFGDARVFGDAVICDNAIICNNAQVYGHTQVCDDTKICNKATVCGEARVCDNAIVDKEMCISGGIFITNTLEESIRCQTGLAPCNGEVIAYKRVNKDLTSLYDNEFKYIVGEWIEAKNPDTSNKSCASGLHFSNATYWDRQVDIHNTTLLIAKIRIEDIITVQQGKIRCKRAFIMGTYDI